MNKKQICKVKYTRTPRYGNEKSEYSMYGVCLSDTEFLLENGLVLSKITMATCNPMDVLNHGGEIRPHMGGNRVGDVQVSPTRNVPPSIRERMENAYAAYTSAITASQQFAKAREEYEGKMVDYKQVLSKFPDEIKHCRGILTGKEFLEAFYEALPANVKSAIKACPNRDYYGNKAGEYSLEIFGNRVALETHIDIEKYFRHSSFTNEEYDGTIQLADGAEKTKEYKSYVREYTHPLPINRGFSREGLSVGGDKDFLAYYAEYNIEIKKPMTAEYAKDLAAEFCGVRRQRAVEQTVEEQDEMER